jgi:hypothetical protein
MATKAISTYTVIGNVADSDQLLIQRPNGTTYLATFNGASVIASWAAASASQASSLDFFEDTDNGTNRVRLIGPASTADVTVTLPATTGTIALTSELPNTFSTIVVSGQSDVVADSATDTLTLVAGTNITLTTNATTDTVTIASAGGSEVPASAVFFLMGA